MPHASLPSAHGAIWSYSDLRPILESTECKQPFEERRLTNFLDTNFLLYVVFFPPTALISTRKLCLMIEPKGPL